MYKNGWKTVQLEMHSLFLQIDLLKHANFKIYEERRHWCLARNLRIAIFNGKSVLNRLLSNGWSDLVDFIGRSPCYFLSNKMGKNQPFSTKFYKYGKFGKFGIEHIANFGQFWPVLAQISFGFLVGKYLFLWRNIRHFQGSFEPKTPTSSHLKPPFWPKTFSGGSKKG